MQDLYKECVPNEEILLKDHKEVCNRGIRYHLTFAIVCTDIKEKTDGYKEKI